MVDLKTLLNGLFTLALWKETQCADKSTIGPKKISARWTSGGRNVLQSISIVVEAKPQPTVYVCSCLNKDNVTCLTKVKNGELEPLKLQNTSDVSLRYLGMWCPWAISTKYTSYVFYLRGEYPEPKVIEGPNLYWYLYKPPYSCHSRSQEIYATIDNKNYIRLLHRKGVMWTPQLSNAVFNESSLCLNVEVTRFENGPSCNFKYRIEIMQKYELLSDRCHSCNQHTWCCDYRTNHWLPIFNGTTPSNKLNFQYCFNDGDIKKPNTTSNGTNLFADRLYRVGKVSLQVSARAIAGEVASSASDTVMLKLFESPLASTTATYAPTTKEFHSNGLSLRNEKLLVIGFVLVLLLHRYLN